MKVTFFRIENFRNIKLAECTNPPDFMVICGGNGCGKSALLNALMTAKEHAAPYGGFHADPRSVSADAELARITMHLQFADREREWYEEQYNVACPESDEIIIEILKDGRVKAIKRSKVAKNLLSSYSRKYAKSPGFFDYIDSHRIVPKKQLSTWDTSLLSDARFKQTLGQEGTVKFQFTKEYLASLVMRDAQEMLASHRAGCARFPDSLSEIKEFFDDFFAPLKFVDVRIDTSPFQYIIHTPRGDIDIDDLSGGEKEILNTFIRFHQLKPRDAIILFDEADAHLHPDIERRYLEILRELSIGNQLWLTTHSPEMMIAAGSDTLYTVLKEPLSDGSNQLVRVSDTDMLHEALSEVMGSRGLVSFNQRIVFIEGEESSTDRLLYEHFYPPGKYNISFVPAGNSATVLKTAEQVNCLLNSGIAFQYYYSIVDGDIERAVDPPLVGRLFKLPVYHVENFLIDEQLILEVTKELLADKCPYENSEQVRNDLCDLVLSDEHIKPFTKALLDARVAKVAKDAWDAVYRGKDGGNPKLETPVFDSVENDSKKLMEEAIRESTWKSKCKGRALLKAYCRKIGIRYEHFRNLLINRIKEPPNSLTSIFDRILSNLS
jgi:predicted ATPase